MPIPWAGRVRISLTNRIDVMGASRWSPLPAYQSQLVEFSDQWLSASVSDCMMICLWGVWCALKRGARIESQSAGLSATSTPIRLLIGPAGQHPWPMAEPPTSVAAEPPRWFLGHLHLIGRPSQHAKHLVTARSAFSSYRAVMASGERGRSAILRDDTCDRQHGHTHDMIRCRT